jgi:hypothetical protein
MFGWFMHFGQNHHEPIAYLMINMYIGKVSESTKTCHKMEIWMWWPPYQPIEHSEKIS